LHEVVFGLGCPFFWPEGPDSCPPDRSSLRIKLRRGRRPAAVCVSLRLISMKSVKQYKKPPLIGAHFSIAKGLHKALYTAQAYGCRALQIFTKNANTWKEKDVSPQDVSLFQKAKIETGIVDIAAHTSYLINLASPDGKKHSMSCMALEKELARSAALDIPYVVLHPGAHMGKGEKDGIRRIAESINRIYSRLPGPSPRLLLETTAGQGSSLGHTFEQLAAILENIERQCPIGVCMDTCHMFAAGYDMRSTSAYRKTIGAFDRIIGLDRLYFIHFNDAKKGLGSRVDRHEHLGHGTIGLKAFDLFMNDRRLRNIPKIIETPKEEEGKDWDKINLDLLRSLVKDKS
jgi:deoxyribonuclease IV